MTKFTFYVQVSPIIQEYMFQDLPSGCLKPWIVPNNPYMYYVFSYAYIPIIKFNL